MAGVSGSVEAARAAALRFFAEGTADTERDRVVMARAAASLFIAGALIGLVSLAFKHEAGSNEAAIAGLCIAGLVTGLAFIFERGRLPTWVFAASSYGATVLVA